MVYLLHFLQPYGHIRHFIGAAPDLETVLGVIYEPARYARSPLLRAAAAAGVQFQIARVEPGGEPRAARLRARKRAAAICPVCREASAGGAVV